MTKSQRCVKDRTSSSDKLTTKSTSKVFTAELQTQSTAKIPSTMPEDDGSEETMDSLVMARRMVASHKPSSHMDLIGTVDDEELVFEHDQRYDDAVVFVSPSKGSKPTMESFCSPQVKVKPHFSSATPGKSPNGVMEGPYGEDSMQYGNDSMDFEEVMHSPAKTPARRTKSGVARSSSPRRSSRLTSTTGSSGTKGDSPLVGSPRRSSRTTRAPSSKRQNSGVARMQPVLSRASSGLHALQSGEQCIAFPNFQDSFISSSSTDHTPCPAFQDSVFTLSQEDNMMLVRDDTDAEDEPISQPQEDTRPLSPTNRRSSLARHRSSRQLRPSTAQRLGQVQQQQLLLPTTPQMHADTHVPVSPRRTNSRRLSKRTPMSPTRTSSALQQRKTQQQASAPVTRYELERRHVLGADLFAEMKTSAADRRRRRHSSVEQQIIKQKCNPRGREADIFGQALQDLDSFNDSFTDLIRRRRANIDEH